ncbi:ABC transporter permease [Candidatus Margulisiibacteriota bacterium]
MIDPTVIKMSYRNLWRRKIRTIIVIICIAVGLTGLIFTGGLYDGMLLQMKESIIKSDIGHITIYKKGFRSSKKLSLIINNPENIEKILAENQNIDTYFRRIKVTGMISSARYTQGVHIIGIEPKREKNASNLAESITKGTYELEPKKNQIIIGAELADKLHVRLKKKVVIMGQAKDKSIVSNAMRVVGVARANDQQIDKYAGFISLEKAQAMFKVDKGVTQISIMLKNHEKLDETQQFLKETLGTEYLDILTWKEQYPIGEFMDVAMQYFMGISYVILFLAVGIGIFDITLISILERIQEFGVLLAIGTRFKKIAQVIIYESLMVGGMAFIVGIILGYSLLITFKYVGIDLSAFAAGVSFFGMSSIMYPTVKISYFFTALIAVSITSFIAVLWPIWILKKLKPIQSISFM